MVLPQLWGDKYEEEGMKWIAIAMCIVSANLWGCETPEDGSSLAAEQQALTAAEPTEITQAENDRIIVGIALERLEPGTLQIDIKFANPYHCDWIGHGYLERHDNYGNILTIARLYNILIPAGVEGHVQLNVEEPFGAYVYYVKAYRPDGEDHASYDNGLPPAASMEADVELNSNVLSISEMQKSPLAEQDVLPCSEVDPRPPVNVALSLTGTRQWIEARTTWKNSTARTWEGDLYVEYRTPNNPLTTISRADFGMTLEPGMGVSTIDRVRRDTTGEYTFDARALHLDGGDAAKWERGGTTEIVSICNRSLCQLITPEQERADITLTGPSSIHLEIDFFSEFTQVTMAYAGGEFDITALCKIEQYRVDDKNHLDLFFDTMNLPIGPRTWAYYTITTNPMPIVPPGSKLYDSIWILTNGPE
jgi:hypothetical protein